MGSPSLTDLPKGPDPLDLSLPSTFIFLETDSLVFQTGLELTIYLKLALNAKSLWVYFLSARIMCGENSPS